MCGNECVYSVHVCFLMSACVEAVNELNVGVTAPVSEERLYAVFSSQGLGGNPSF